MPQTFHPLFYTERWIVRVWINGTQQDTVPLKYTDAVSFRTKFCKSRKVLIRHTKIIRLGEDGKPITDKKPGRGWQVYPNGEKAE